MKGLEKKVLMLLFGLAVGALFLCAGCSKDEDGTQGGGSVKVTYKIIGSSDTKINTVVYYSGSNPASATGDFGSTWEKEATVENKAMAMVTASANGLSQTSTLKAQILIDGKVVKESTPSTGTTLSAQVSLSN